MNVMELFRLAPDLHYMEPHNGWHNMNFYLYIEGMCGVVKGFTGKIHSWMENNLEEPLLKAEMAKAVPTGSRTPAAVYVSVAAGMVALVCWLFASFV